MSKIHYRKAFNSPYLSSADIIEPTVLTVACVKFEKDQTKRSKDDFNVLYFEEKKLPSGEPTKPMILNSGNNEIIRKFSGGSKYIDEWDYGYPVTIFVESNVRFGRDTVEGLRLMTEKPRIVKASLEPKTKAWDNAVIAYKRDKNFDAIEKRMTISPENKELLKKEAEHVS